MLVVERLYNVSLYNLITIKLTPHASKAKNGRNRNKVLSCKLLQSINIIKLKEKFTSSIFDSPLVILMLMLESFK